MRNVCCVLTIALIAWSLSAEPCPQLPNDPNCRTTWFVRNLEPGDQYPDHFRRTDDSYRHSCDWDGEACPSRVGLEKVNASGSGQPSIASYRRIAGLVPLPLVAIDLRQESHGFIGDLPVSWYLGRDQINCNKSDSKIADDEAKLLRALGQQTSTQPMKLHKPADENKQCNFADKPITVAVKDVKSEAT